MRVLFWDCHLAAALFHELDVLDGRSSLCVPACPPPLRLSRVPGGMTRCRVLLRLPAACP